MAGTTHWTRKSAGFPISGDLQVFLSNGIKTIRWDTSPCRSPFAMLELLGNALGLPGNHVFCPSHRTRVKSSPHEQQGLKSSEPLPFSLNVRQKL